MWVFIYSVKNTVCVKALVSKWFNADICFLLSTAENLDQNYGILTAAKFQPHSGRFLKKRFSLHNAVSYRLILKMFYIYWEEILRAIKRLEIVDLIDKYNWEHSFKPALKWVLEACILRFVVIFFLYSFENVIKNHLM